MRRAIGAAALAVGLLALTGCDSGDETAETAEADPAAPFWDAWDDMSEDDQEALCLALEDFGEEWAVDYGEEEPMDAELWAETLVTACQPASE